MKNTLIAIGLILVGAFFFYMTYKDGRKRKAELTTDYVMHLKGYGGGVGFVILGLILLFRNI